MLTDCCNCNTDRGRNVNNFIRDHSQHNDISCSCCERTSNRPWCNQRSRPILGSNTPIYGTIGNGKNKISFSHVQYY